METDLHAVIRANILEPVHKQFIVYQSLKVARWDPRRHGVLTALTPPRTMAWQAMRFCHTCQLLHRDLKPSNLLLNEVPSAHHLPAP